MNILQKNVSFAVAGAVVMVFAAFAPMVHAQEYSGCDFCGADYSYSPGYDYSYTPTSDYTYTPGYDYSYTPGYDSTYTPGYDSTYYPSYDSTYYPSYDNSYYPSYDTTGYSSYIPSVSYYPTDIVTPSPTPIPPAPTPYPAPSPLPTPHVPNFNYSVAPIATPISITAPQQQDQAQAQSQNTTVNQANSQTNNQSITQPINITNNNINNIPAQQPVVQYIPQYVPQYIPQQPAPIYYNQPSCTLTASGSTLSWSTQYATSAYLNDGIGSVALNGSIQAHPNTGTNYVLTVTGQNGQQATCTAYMNGVAPYVTLSQIPYTGFDFGPIGNSIYWIALALFALAAAYLMIYYRGGAVAFARQMTANTVKTENVKIKSVVSPITAPVAARSFILPTADVAAGRISNSNVTNDRMEFHFSKGEETPRITITRS